MTIEHPVEWLPVPIPPFNHYEVSSHGRVRRDGREVQGDVNKDGYHRVLLSHAGKAKRFIVSRLVCHAFHGAPFDRAEACHGDGDRLNNRASNLAWGTHAENSSHKVGHGTLLVGEAHPCAVLTAERAKEAWLSPLSTSELASQFGVSTATIRDVRVGKNWRTVTAALGPQPTRPRSARGRVGSQAIPIPAGFREAYASGLRGLRLASKFGVSRNLVWKWGKNPFGDHHEEP